MFDSSNGSSNIRKLNVTIIMPPETSTEEALRDFCMTNDFDRQEHIIHVINMHSCFLPDFLLLPVYT